MTFFYYLETLFFRAGTFHKQCLYCGHCRRTLDALTLNDAQDDIFCAHCYGDNFGVVGKGTSSGRVDTTKVAW